MAAIGEHGVRWTSNERQLDKEQVLQQQLGIPSLLACVLVNRGFDTPEAADRFLSPRMDDLASPTLLPDFEAARDEILKAREQKDTIYVHGDYDVDGVTSAALLTRFLQKVGATVHAHVPHRMKEGYGIHLQAVEEARKVGAKLFLTCDCGVSAHEQVEAAKEAGMRVVVTDHHSIGAKLPDAAAVVNPHRKDSQYPYKELSGCGVAFRLCEGLTAELGINKHQYWRAYLDLTVLGTVADVMPLTGENRIITYHGLKQLAETRKPGLQALLRESKVLEESGGKLRAHHIGFMLGPRLNASGRIDDAARSLSLLLTVEDGAATSIAQAIEEINTRRREEQSRIVDDAVKRVLEERLHEKFAIVVGEEGWHPGIIGLVAGRLVEMFRRPAFVLSIDSATNSAKGSARSIPGFNLADAIRAHGHLVDGGGHAMAAGFSTSADKISQVAEAFDAYASQMLTEADFEVLLNVEAVVSPEEVTFGNVECLDLLEPYGCENPHPIFSVKGMRVVRITPTKNPLHAQVSLRSGTGKGPLVRGIAFSMGERLAQFEPGFEADLLIQPRIEEWNGMRSMKWEIKHFEPCAEATGN